MGASCVFFTDILFLTEQRTHYQVRPRVVSDHVVDIQDSLVPACSFLALAPNIKVREILGPRYGVVVKGMHL
jgi:hypothetical protein